ncbi:ABC transporter permease [Streptomyces sp. NPDC006645]|uniref:ABC transporter permease n=1 Tax=unclassified Streptomyces TaxID=2593676 RepID=UPI0033AF484C
MSIPATEVAVLDAAPAPTPSKRARLRFLRGGKTLTGLSILGFFTLLAIIGPWIAPYDPDMMSDKLLQPPSGDHWFGTTQTGQDVLSQILVGTRGVLLVGFIAGFFATVLSVLIGVTSGFLGGVMDEILSALSNIFLVIPALPLIIIIASFVSDAGDLLIAGVIAFTSWAWGARVLRAQTLSLRKRDYVEAARATGEPTWRIIGFEIMPNLTAVIASGFVGTVIFAVLLEITLAFIGVADISNWNWGTVLFWAQSNQALAQGAWWWFVPAGLCIALLGTALALINFGIDEFVNPRLRTETGSSRTIRMRVGFTPVARTTERTKRTNGAAGTSVAAGRNGAAATNGAADKNGSRPADADPPERTGPAPARTPDRTPDKEPRA